MRHLFRAFSNIYRRPHAVCNYGSRAKTHQIIIIGKERLAAWRFSKRAVRTEFGTSRTSGKRCYISNCMHSC